MPSMMDHMRALFAATGWAALEKPDVAGVWHVALEDDIDAVFFSLGDRICVMRGVVADVPNTTAEAEALCAEAAHKQLAALRERPSVLALEEPGTSAVPGEADVALARLVCFRTIPLDVETETLLAEVQAWLNDLSWWKAALGQGEPQGTAMGTFFNADMFSSGLRP